MKEWIEAMAKELSYRNGSQDNVSKVRRCTDIVGWMLKHGVGDVTQAEYKELMAANAATMLTEMYATAISAIWQCASDFCDVLLEDIDISSAYDAVVEAERWEKEEMDNECKLMCDREELYQPEFIDGVDMDDLGEVIEAARDARDYISLDVDVYRDGVWIGSWTSDGWRPRTMCRIVEWQTEILYSHSGNHGTARNADGAREYAERGEYDRDADVIADSMTHDEAVDAIKEYKCEIRRCRFHVGSGWCAYIKYAEEYEIDSAGDSVPLSGIEFAEWEMPDNG